MDDPWDWDVERVVKELCTSNQSWVPRYPSCLPDDFAQSLRENDVDGFGLLTATFPDDMKELGLHQYKQRKWVLDAIYQLRGRSTRYIEQGQSHSVNPHVPRPKVGSKFGPAAPLDALPMDKKRVAEENLQEFQNKKTKVDAVEDHSSRRHLEGTVQSTLENASSKPSAAVRKVRRIAPTFVSAIDPNKVRDIIPSAADHVMIHAAAVQRVMVETSGNEFNTGEENRPGNEGIGSEGREDNSLVLGLWNFDAIRNIANSAQNSLDASHHDVEVTAEASDDVGDSEQPSLKEASSEPSMVANRKLRRIAPTFVSAIDPDKVRESIPSAADHVKIYVGTEPKVTVEAAENASLHDYDEETDMPMVLRTPDDEETTMTSADDANVHEQKEVSGTGKTNEREEPVVQSNSANAALDDQKDPRKIFPLLKANEGEAEPAAGGQPKSGAPDQTTADVKSRKANRPNLAQGYLGKEKMLVEDIFYGKDLVDPEDGERVIPGQFLIRGQDLPPGCRLYVNSRIKEFLGQHNAIRGCSRFSRGGKSYLAILPYPACLVPDCQERFFTLLSKSDDGEVCASKEAVSEWPEAIPETSLDAAAYGKTDANWLEGLSSGPQLDLDALEERYKNLPGDTILPYLNESDSDDDDAWKEIEAENGTLVRSNRPALSPEQVQAAINEAIAVLMEKWQTVVLPKLAHKGWQIHREFRRLGKKARVLRKRQLEVQVAHLNGNRIPRVRGEIAREVWSSPRQVRQQTIGTLEVTIFERERMLWELSILRNKMPPPEPVVDQFRPTKEKPTAESPHKVQSRLENVSDDGIGSFIEDDSELEDAAAVTADEAPSDWSDVEEVRNKLDCSAKSIALRTDASASNAPVRQAEPSDVPLDVDEQDIKSTDVIPPHTPSTAPSRESLADPKGEKIQSPRGISSGKAPIVNLVDLTQLTDSSAPSRPRTPSKRSKKELSPRSRQETTDLTTPNKVAQKVEREGTSKFIVVSSDSESNIPVPPAPPAPLPSMTDLPPYHEISQIAKKLTYDVLERLQDRDRLVIKFLHTMKPETCSKLLAEFEKLEKPILWTTFKDVLHVMFFNQPTMEGWEPEKFDTYIVIVRMFQMFVQCKYRPPISHQDAGWSGISNQLVTDLEKEAGLFSTLYDRIRSFAKTIEKGKGNQDDEDDGKDSEDEQREISRHSWISPHSEPSGSDDNLMTPVLRKKRKRKKRIVENAEALELRTRNKIRAEQLQQRREQLKQKLASQGISTVSDPHHIIINDGKRADEGYVYIHETIGARIKPHQIAGVRFMWEQIVTDRHAMQGCLLAHTMGLGKTMQVITLLVAIQEAARSEDESVSKQIPPSLRSQVFRTLVLCPPTIIDNWEDELLHWAPKHILGDPFKITSQMGSIYIRLETIERWYSEGGVMIIGYDMFRSLLSNKAPRGKYTPLSEEELETLRTRLLDGPDLIIADEAHKLKNAMAQVSVFASQFASNSRIALTGSPLNNSVQEYFHMVDWVAPNYLGPLAEFKSTYQEPIEAGLWAESTRAARKESQKLLKVLISELNFKVNRATMQTLKNDLPPKREFVLQIALTDRQKELYTRYVRHMSRKRVLDTVELTKAGEISQTTLWSWLAILSLLCNHPGLFRNKIAALTQSKPREPQRGIARQKKKNSTPVSDDDENSAEEEEMTSVGTAISQAGWGKDMMNFLDSIEDIMSPLLSNKVRILNKIFDECRVINDKVLVFSQSIPTMDYLERNICQAAGRKYFRLDGKTRMNERQGMTKEFNEGKGEIFLISTKAGGLGLNLPAANRVVIMDFKHNPTQEEQAIGRAYRIGQVKPVFVYRFVAAGTFETKVHNTAVYKTQLASRVVDKENPLAWAKKSAAEYLAEPEDVDQEDLTEFEGEDNVLDKILHDKASASVIRSILKTDTFAEADNEPLTKEDEEDIERQIKDVRLKREDPQGYERLLQDRARQEAERLEDFRRQQLDMNTRNILTMSTEVRAGAIDTATANSPMRPKPGYSPYLRAPEARQYTEAEVVGLLQDNREERSIPPIRAGFTREQPDEYGEIPMRPAKPSPSPEKPAVGGNELDSDSMLLGGDAVPKTKLATPGPPKEVRKSIFKSFPKSGTPSTSKPRNGDVNQAPEPDDQPAALSKLQAAAANSGKLSSFVSSTKDGAGDENPGYLQSLMKKFRDGSKPS